MVFSKFSDNLSHNWRTAQPTIAVATQEKIVNALWSTTILSDHNPQRLPIPSSSTNELIKCTTMSPANHFSTLEIPCPIKLKLIV